MFDNKSREVSGTFVGANPGFYLLKFCFDPSVKPSAQEITKRSIFWPIIAWKLSPTPEPITIESDVADADNVQVLIMAPNGKLYEHGSSAVWDNFDHWSGQFAFGHWQELRRAWSAAQPSPAPTPIKAGEPVARISRWG
jgi:hypothetical protein